MQYKEYLDHSKKMRNFGADVKVVKSGITLNET